MNKPNAGKAARKGGRGQRGGRSILRECSVRGSPSTRTSNRLPVRGGACQRIGCAQLMATGTRVLTDVPCVLAGMHRGSSVRSHQSGAAGGSRTWAASLHPSADSRSHMQSAASTDAASSKSTAAIANAWRRGLMRAKSKSTARTSARNKSKAELGWRGVKPKLQDVG